MKELYKSFSTDNKVVFFLPNLLQFSVTLCRNLSLSYATSNQPMVPEKI